MTSADWIALVAGLPAVITALTALITAVKARDTAKISHTIMQDALKNGNGNGTVNGTDSPHSPSSE
jgi:hypothetical protein